MSYEVDSRKEVRQRLEELGVDSVRDIRRAGGAHHHDAPAAIQAEQLNLQAHGAPDSMAVVTDDLLRTSGAISDARDEIHEILDEIRELGGHQFDGWGPISDRIATCMSDRAGPDTGAEAAVASYLAELGDLDAALTHTAALYAAVEQDSMEQLRRATRDNG